MAVRTPLSGRRHADVAIAMRYPVSPDGTDRREPRDPDPTRLLDRLDLPAIDVKWQRIWAERDTYRADMEGPRPFYCLMMFPYPSAEKLHIGNAYAFTGADV